ncbi:ATP-binding protein (plasmid) [Sphingomonas paeninsulae]|jgi:serine/threonine-protein kinase RsbW|uniref:ATP-binding protein n=1 Tax=Sphingomonas paeninsulae TaxID=2319844 RepID=A0A494T7B8_SPHPE|nr:ATP-binding protein [Sphingomonas paeninsulae]AYJ84780.1 ATP-binding protein [Sphingomonas paeninsulae]
MVADFSRTLSGDTTAFVALLEAIEVYLKEHDVPDLPRGRLMIAFDEVISNIRNHGGAQGHTPRIDVRIAIGDRSVEVEIRDDGIAFDPVDLKTPDTSLSIEEREIGGLGIHLVHALMDEVRYERQDGVNLLRLSLGFRLP